VGVLGCKERGVVEQGREQHVCEHVPICVAEEQDCQDSREEGACRPFPNFSGGFLKTLLMTVGLQPAKGREPPFGWR
jgi:hypothetical protein